MQLVILSNPITKKNSPRIIKRKDGRPILLPSKQYVDYEKTALHYLNLQVPKNWQAIDYPVNVKCLYYMQTRRKVDLVNLQEATLDILVKSGFLADDNCGVVYSMDGSKVLYDKENPRVEIEITQIQVQSDAL